MNDITLKHGQSAVFSGLPVGSFYKITELGNGYTPSYTVTNTGTGGNETIASLSGSNLSSGNPLSTYQEKVDQDEVITVTFTNTPKQTQLYLPVTKVLTGDTPSTDVGFEFTLAGQDDAPLPSATVRTITGAGSSQFGPITYTQPGTYTYTVTETNDGEPGYIYDTATRTVSVTVTDSNGVLSASYAVSVDGTPADSIKFTNEYHVVSITVTKDWDDNSNQDGIRPETLTLTLNGMPSGMAAPAPTITGTDGNSWTYTWSGLPKYDNGTVITYTVSENSVPTGYEVSGSPAQSGGTITNSHTPEETEATVKKVWSDANNQDGIRPTELIVTLSNGDSVTLSAPDWEGTITGLPKYANGTEITYTWTEASITGYTLANTSVNGTVTTLTNSHTPVTIDISGTKVWEDFSNSYNTRPATITIILYKDGNTTPFRSQTIDVTAADTLNWSFTGLPKYTNGVECTYTVDEIPVPDYYDKTVDNDTYTITNTLGVASLQITKSVVGAPAGSTASFTLQVTVMQGTTGINGTYGDVTFTDGVATVTLTGGQTLTIPNLPIGATYEVTEPAGTLPAGWSLTGTTGTPGTIDPTTPGEVTLTNTFTPASIQIAVKKIVEGDSPNTEELFTFTLAKVGDAPMPTSGTTVSVLAGQTGSFGSITYNTPGVY